MGTGSGVFWGTHTPVRAALPGFELPDGDGVLEGVNAELCSRKRFSSMRRRYRYDDRHLSYFKPSHAMEEGQTADVRPAGPGGSCHIGEPWHDMLLLCLVLQRRHTGPPIGVVAHGAAERDDAPTFGGAGPLPGVVDRELTFAYGDPVVADRPLQLGRRHEATRWIGPAPSRSEGALTPARREMISAQIDTAVSSGVRAPIF